MGVAFSLSLSLIHFSGPIFICLPKWMVLVFVVGKLGQHSRCVFDNTIKKAAKKQSTEEPRTIEIITRMNVRDSEQKKAIERKKESKKRHNLRAQLYFSGFKLFYFNAISFNKCWFILWLYIYSYARKHIFATEHFIHSGELQTTWMGQTKVDKFSL